MKISVLCFVFRTYVRLGFVDIDLDHVNKTPPEPAVDIYRGSYARHPKYVKDYFEHQDYNVALIELEQGTEINGRCKLLLVF